MKPLNKKKLAENKRKLSELISHRKKRRQTKFVGAYDEVYEKSMAALSGCLDTGVRVGLDMREIKFRVWLFGTLREKGQMAYPDHLNRLAISLTGGLVELTGSASYRTYDWVEYKKHEKMQYTGIKDKNGIEIYEGDIVTFSVENQSSYIGPTRGSVEFNIHNCSFGIKTNKAFISINHGYDAYPGTLQVIGNIYENPELLKE